MADGTDRMTLMVLANWDLGPNLLSRLTLLLETDTPRQIRQ